MESHFHGHIIPGYSDTSVIDTEVHDSENESSDCGIRVEDSPKFDIESYIANYSGRTRFDRLYLIGTCSTYLSVEALRLAVTEALDGVDVRNYQKAVEALSRVSPLDSDAVLDTTWMDRTSKTMKTDTERLEHELKGYKNNLIKESIRMGNEDLGQHYHQIGDLGAASKAYSRMREYCTTTTHLASMLFKVINVAVDRRDWLAVQSNVYRLRNLQFKPEEESKNQAKMWASLGLSQLATGAYLDAAVSFMSTDPALAGNYREVISANDIAVYGGLCALASMNRVDLVNRVLENKLFRNFLELEPHIRRAISFFCSSKFRQCLDILGNYRADYLLDIHLQPHVRYLYTQIRTKAMQQYIVPYSRVALASMENVFSPGCLTLGKIGANGIASPFLSELVELIQDGTLEARIDMEAGVLITNQRDDRLQKHRAALEIISNYLNTAHVQLLQLNIWHAGLEIPDFSTSDPRPLREGGWGHDSEQSVE